MESVRIIAAWFMLLSMLGSLLWLAGRAVIRHVNSGGWPFDDTREEEGQ